MLTLDDESLFAGATLARHALAGESVVVIALSDGVKSRRGWAERDVTRRREQFTRACKVLGADDLLEPIFDDQQSDQVPQLIINRAVERWIAWSIPRIVYTHHVGDLNLDHRRVAEAVLVATRGCSGVFSMAPEFPSRCVGPGWHPDVTVDTLATLELKVAACKCYADEMRPYPHPRSERAIREQPLERFMEIR